MRPASITSNGSPIVEPPAPGTFAAVASTSATLTYVFQCGGTPGIGSGAIAATSLPFFLAIEYTALSFLQPSQVRFLYKLEGYDADWIDAGSRRSAFYTNLPSGAYRFQVQACNSDGVWNRVGDQLSIAQQPHFYERAWFYGAVLLGLTVTGFVLHRWRTAVLR